LCGCERIAQRQQSMPAPTAVPGARAAASQARARGGAPEPARPPDQTYVETPIPRGVTRRKQASRALGQQPRTRRDAVGVAALTAPAAHPAALPQGAHPAAAPAASARPGSAAAPTARTRPGWPRPRPALAPARGRPAATRSGRRPAPGPRPGSGAARRSTPAGQRRSMRPSSVPETSGAA